MKPTQVLAIAALLASSLASSAVAQTGPGGVGTTDGTSSLKVWLNAGRITGTASGSPIGTWEDQSGNGNNATQSTGANQPTFQTGVVNGRPVLRFDGSNDQLVLPRIVGDDFTIITVFRSTAGNGNGNTQWYQGAGLVDAEVAGVTNDFGTSLGSDGRVVSGVGNPDVSFASGSGFNDGNAHFYAFWRYRNYGTIAQSVDATGGAASPTGIQSLTTPTRIVIGSLQSNINYLDGDIAEVIIYDRALNYAESTVLGNYLSAKYNISIGGYDRYANPDASYILDVAGIGNEFAANPLTDGSISEAHSAGFLLRDNIFLSNNTYALFGHRSVTNGWTSVDVPSGIPARWIRDWYIDRTGGTDADLLDVGFDFSEGGFSSTPGDPNGYHLLYRARLSDPWTIYPGDPVPSVNGDRLIFEVGAGDLDDGYYTLGGPIGDARLPVELSSFSARIEAGHVRIDWRTASEIDNAGFILSRSEGEGSDFISIASHHTDAALQGQGTSSLGARYSYIDVADLHPGKTYFYRIQDVATDGTIGSHAGIAAVTVPTLALPPATSSGHRLGQNIPNPAHSITRIPLVTPEAETIRLTMYDNKGREIARHTLQVSQGINTIDLDVSTLPPGNYLYQITAGTTVLTRVMTVTP